MIVAENLCKSYARKTYLQDICVCLNKGQALAVAGENGAGKTTLLRLLATVLRPDSGALTIGGINALAAPKRARRLIGYVPQGIALMQELSVGDNLRYWMAEKDEARYRDTLGVIGLEDTEKKRVSKLSGGMQRRLNIGASLVTAPSVLILDEPLAGVDSENRRRIIAHFAALKESGVTIVFTSHYMDEMRRLADALIVLKDGRAVYNGGSEIQGNVPFSDMADAAAYTYITNGGQ